MPCEVNCGGDGKLVTTVAAQKFRGSQTPKYTPPTTADRVRGSLHAGSNGISNYVRSTTRSSFRVPTVTRQWGNGGLLQS